MYDSEESNLRSTAREDYDRIQARKLDALHFRLQQAINLKDDEITRLKDEIAYLEAQMNVCDDKKLSKNGPIDERIQNLKFKIFKSQQKYALLITNKKTDYTKEINAVNMQHQEQVNRLRKEIEDVMFNDNIMSSKDAQFSDPVDAFLESINSKKYRNKISEDSQKSDIPPPFIQKTLEDVQKIEDKNMELKEHIKDLENQINKVQKQIAEAEAQNISNLSDDSETIDDDSFDIHDESADSEIEDLETKFQEDLDHIRKGHQAKVAQFKQKIARQEKAIAKFANVAFNSSGNDESYAQSARRSNTSRSSRMDATQSIYNEIASLTDAQKEKKRKALLIENASLKREIGRLDYMVYGKAGKYAKWRNIKV